MIINKEFIREKNGKKEKEKEEENRKEELLLSNPLSFS